MRGLIAGSWPVLLLAVLLAACDAREPGPEATPRATAPAAPEAAETDLVPLNDEAGAETLAGQRQIWRGAVEDLLEHPDAARLAGARDAWAALYQAFNDHYLSLAASACQRGVPERLERLDAWPFYPAYVDALPAWPDSGIVNDPALELNASSLRRQQGATTEGEVALGFQPLQLLVAGVPRAPRQPTDFQAGQADAAAPTTTVEEEAAVQVDAPARRRDYLRLASEQLAADLEALSGDAATNADSLHCALRVLDQRLAHLDRQRQATDPEGGLYLAARSIELIDASQPETALRQLATDDNADLRDALEERWPGFRDALRQARENDDWTPLRAWLGGDGGGVTPAAAVRG